MNERTRRAYVPMDIWWREPLADGLKPISKYLYEAQEGR